MEPELVNQMFDQFMTRLAITLVVIIAANIAFHRHIVARLGASFFAFVLGVGLPIIQMYDIARLVLFG